MPVASVRSSGSASSSHSSFASGYEPSSTVEPLLSDRPPLSPIMDVSMSREASRTFVGLAPVPAIAPKTRLQHRTYVQTLGIQSVTFNLTLHTLTCML